MAGKVTLYTDDEGKTRWHRLEGGNITGESGEGYTSKSHAREQAEAAMQPGDELVDATEDDPDIAG